MCSAPLLPDPCKFANGAGPLTLGTVTGQYRERRRSPYQGNRKNGCSTFR